MPLSSRQWRISPNVFLRCLCYVPPFPIVGSHQGNQEDHTGQYTLDKYPYEMEYLFCQKAMGQLFLQFAMLLLDHILKVITHSIVVKLHNTPPF